MITTPTRPGASRRAVRRFLAAMASAAVLAGCGTLWFAGQAKAEPGVGCETIRWGLFGGQLRTICDGPRRPDGSWTRERRIWTPEGWVRGYCTFGTYGSGCSEGYYRQATVQGYESYVVFDSNVLPDEPGWLPAGTVILR